MRVQGIQKGFSKFFKGNTPSGAVATTAGGMFKSTGRSLLGAKPGEKLFEKGHHYVTRPLRALMPNLGAPLNTVRGAALAGYGGYLGSKGYAALGDTAETMRSLSDKAYHMGAPSDVVADMGRYTSRSGVLGAWLRGHRGTAWMAGGNKGLTERQKLMDRLAAGAADEMTFEAMSGAMGSRIKPHEVLNPGGALLSRGIASEIGRANVTEELQGWREKLRSGISEIMKSRGNASDKVIQDTGSELSQGLRAFWERHGRAT